MQKDYYLEQERQFRNGPDSRPDFQFRETCQAVPLETGRGRFCTGKREKSKGRLAKSVSSCRGPAPASGQGWDRDYTPRRSGVLGSGICSILHAKVLTGIFAMSRYVIGYL